MELAEGGAGSIAHHGRHAGAARRRRRRSKNLSDSSRCITSPARTAISTLPCFPIGRMPKTKLHVGQTKALLATSPSNGIARVSIAVGPGPGGGPVSCCCTAIAYGTRGESRWIGWERKRGKLHELNRLLRGATDTTFVMLGIHTPAVSARCAATCITLDADTRLPREAARKLIGKMAHPLNRPRARSAKPGRVVEGHAILQPRVTPRCPIGREGSLFQRVFSAAARPRSLRLRGVRRLSGPVRRGLVLPARASTTSTLFEAALAGRVPDSTLLEPRSVRRHLRARGLVSDVEVVEEFPVALRRGAAARQHRWVRGDWQLLPWILGYGRDQRGRKHRVHLIGRWKMADNLRRSLLAPTVCWP